MSVRVAGMWELGWNTPIKEADLWIYPMKDFEVEKIFMTPVSGIDNGKIEERKTLEEILKENSDHTAVFCDERAKINLHDFKHPENALYVFGKANYSPLLNIKRDKDLEVKIETIGSKGALWPHQAATVILYDRYLKQK